MRVMDLWIEIIVLSSIILMVVSIMIVLVVEILNTTKNVAKQRKKESENKRIKTNYSNIYRYK